MGFKIEFRNRLGVLETHDLAPGIAVELMDDLRKSGARQITVIAPTGERLSAKEAAAIFSRHRSKDSAN